jgi:hypothetical protein
MASMPPDYVTPPFELGFPNERAKSADDKHKYRCQPRPGVWAAVWPMPGDRYCVNIYHGYEAYEDERAIKGQVPVFADDLLGVQLVLFDLIHRYDKLTRGSNDDGAIQYEEF